jgi:hypothetical protein
MAAPHSETTDLPPGPGLARRWWVTLPCLLGGTLLPIALADAVAVWHNWASRPNADFSRVIAQFAPGVAIWSGLALIAGLIALLVTRRAVTDWPRIGVLTAAPSLVALAIIGGVAGLSWNLLFLLDVPLAALLGVGAYLLIGIGVRRLVERAGADTIDTGLDVRLDLGEHSHLLLRHDRMVVVERTGKWAVSWYDFRALRVRDGDVEVLGAGRRVLRVDPARASFVVAAIRLRVQWVRRHPLFAARRDQHRRRRAPQRAYRGSYAPGTGIGATGLTIVFMVTMPVAAIVLVIAAVHAAPGDRPQMVIGVVASVVIGVWAHVRFWRRRAQG